MCSGWKSFRCERKVACNGPGFNAGERCGSLTQQSSRCAVNFLHVIYSRLAGLLWFRSAWVCLLWFTGVTGCRHVGMNHSLKEKMIKIYIDLHKWSQLGLIYGGVSNGRAGVLLYFPCPVANNEDFALGQISNKGKNIVYNKCRSAEIADFSLFFIKATLQMLH